MAVLVLQLKRITIKHVDLFFLSFFCVCVCVFHGIRNILFICNLYDAYT